MQGQGRRFQRRQARPNEKIYISNLSMDTSQDDLRKKFDSFGTISDVSLKQKDTGIVFAFIEYDSTQSAEKAVEDMNGKDFNGKQIKVQFARGQNNRDRGDRGDRGGYRGDRRGGRDDHRSFGDRPKGCFNCGEEGHFARDCQKPRKERQFNRDRDQGGYRGNRDYKGGNDRGDRRDRDRDRERDRKRQDSNSRSRSKSGDKKKKSRKRSDSY